MRYTVACVALLLLFIGGIALTQNGENPHGPLKFDCQDCHTTDSWERLRPDMKFNHDETGFRMDGAHQQAACASCHKDLVFSHIGTACADCHTDHHQGQLGTSCNDCHTPRDWQPRRDVLQSHAERGFPLTGVHAVADCEACHHGRDRQEFVGTPTNCEACHAADAARAIDPDHRALAFEHDCERCHHAASGSWERTTYDHPASFALTGAHRLIECSACHADGFSGTPTQCYDCHAAAYAAATDPNHVEGGFAQSCENCHSTSAWTPATFDHNTTGFVLEGRHRSASCVSCHESTWAGTPSTCFACHQADFETANDPNHVTSNFSTECATCHSANGWEPATFDHNATGFALTGRHSTVACVGCHVTTYSGTPSNCFACHQADYVGTIDPNHSAANFPTDCQNCHTANGWTPANWDHDAQYFPIYSGAHQGRWSDCVECHIVPSDFSQFSCTDCHEHNKTDTDNDHNEVANYQYQSSACYECHPRGNH